jgi:hypothetical protein
VISTKTLDIALKGHIVEEMNRSTDQTLSDLPLPNQQSARSSVYPNTHNPKDSTSHLKPPEQPHPDDVILGDQKGAAGLYRRKTERIKAASKRGWAAFMASLGRRWDHGVNARAAWPRVIYSIVGVFLCAVWFGVT